MGFSFLKVQNPGQAEHIQSPPMAVLPGLIFSLTLALLLTLFDIPPSEALVLIAGAWIGWHASRICQRDADADQDALAFTSQLSTANLNRLNRENEELTKGLTDKSAHNKILQKRLDEALRGIKDLRKEAHHRNNMIGAHAEKLRAAEVKANMAKAKTERAVKELEKHNREAGKKTEEWNCRVQKQNQAHTREIAQLKIALAKKSAQVQMLEVSHEKNMASVQTEHAERIEVLEASLDRTSDTLLAYKYELDMWQRRADAVNTVTLTTYVDEEDSSQQRNLQGLQCSDRC